MSPMPDVDSLDLNLLRVLAALLETQSITRAGERLGLSQPAASRAVARLREALGDPLLVRTSAGYVLTPHLESLRPHVEAAMRAVANVLAPAAFDASATTRAFRLATTDYGAMVVLTRLAPRFMALAPNARLDVQPWTGETLADLERGALDLALFADEALPPDFHYRELFVETYVCLVRRGHPLASGWSVTSTGPRRGRRSGAARAEQRQASLPLEAFVAYPHAVMTFPDGRGMSSDDLFARLGAPPKQISLRLPYFLAAPWIIADSDLVLAVPQRIAEKLVRIADLQTLSLPAGVETFPYRMIWHERGHRDPAQRWLRTLLVDLHHEERRA